MSDGAGFSWFSADDARDLADIDSVELSDDMVDTMVERLNGCAHQFIFIAWQLQQRQKGLTLRECSEPMARGRVRQPRP